MQQQQTNAAHVYVVSANRLAGVLLIRVVNEITNNFTLPLALKFNAIKLNLIKTPMYESKVMTNTTTTSNIREIQFHILYSLTRAITITALSNKLAESVECWERNGIAIKWHGDTASRLRLPSTSPKRNFEQGSWSSMYIRACVGRPAATKRFRKQLHSWVADWCCTAEEAERCNS